MLVGRAGLSPVMVGRSAELARLRSLIGASPSPCIAFVAGEAGIGKTRLVQELVAQAPAGTVVLAGQAEPGSVGRPMELFLDALRHVDVAAHADLVDVLRDPGRLAEERVCAAVELVDRLCEACDGLVVLEDLHWADSESLSVFEQLATPEHGSLVLIGTYRPDGLSRRHPAGELLPRLERRHAVTHVHLSRLSPADVSTFLGAVLEGDPSYRAVDTLHSRTGGNPYFLEELVATALDAPGQGIESAPLPWSIAELVGAQVEGLEPQVREIVAAASVLGRRVSFDLLAEVTGTDEVELIDLLRSAVDAGLLVETDPDVFSFHHDLARESIEAGLLGRQRRRLHEAALDALRRAGSGDHVAIAHHAEGAGRYAEMVAAARLGARESLARGSSYQALQLAEMGLTEAEDDLELRSAATRAAWLVGLLDEAVDHADAWLQHARAAGDISQEAAALSLRVRVAYDLGDLAAMEELTDALIAAVDQLPSDEERARAMAAVAQSYMLRDQVGPTCEWADKALGLAGAHGFDDVRRAAMVEKGSVLVMEPASADEGHDLLQAAAAEAEQAGDRVLAARALLTLVWQARQSSKVEEARALVERMRAHAEAAGFDSLASHARVEAVAVLAAADGDLDAAIEVLEAGAREDPSRTPTRNRRWLAVLRAGLALEADDLVAAAEHTEEAKPATARSLGGVLGLDAHLAARRGDLAATRTALAGLAAVIADDGYAPPSHIHDIAVAALRAGLTADEVRPLVEQVGFFPGHHLDDDHPWRQLLDAQLAEREERHQEAAALYSAAAESAEEGSGVLARHRGTAHVGAARCLIALGDLDAARAHAMAAAERLARWRGWRVTELEQVQRRLGLGPEPAGPESLTPREREVAALLVEGLGNTALAERLFISPRTAAVHVSNILTKLGMSSRTEVATWAMREGLGPSSQR
jgi:DNA-binding CsgD family transcriptional regulator